MKKVETISLIEELETDGHSPMKFICSDGAVYYVKYLSGKSFDKNEINCLVFEMLCTFLLKELGIPVPEQGFVEIQQGSYIPGQLRVNKRTLKPGVIGWGSKEIPGADLVRGIDLIHNKAEFKRYLNPDDLIKIAIFDLWVDNSDRHTNNYNLLKASSDGKLQFIPIDHAFAFGGLKGMHIFNETILPDSRNKLIVSPYFQSVAAHMKITDRVKIGRSFLSLLANFDVIRHTNEVFKAIPAAWGINSHLENRIISFLQSNLRLDEIIRISSEQLGKNFRRKQS